MQRYTITEANDTIDDTDIESRMRKEATMSGKSLLDTLRNEFDDYSYAGDPGSLQAYIHTNTGGGAESRSWNPREMKFKRGFEPHKNKVLDKIAPLSQKSAITLGEYMRKFMMKSVKSHFGESILFGPTCPFNRLLMKWLYKHYPDIVTKYCRKNWDTVNLLIGKSLEEDEIHSIYLENDASFFLKVAPSTFMYVHPAIDNGVITIFHECYIFGKKAYNILREIVSEKKNMSEKSVISRHLIWTNDDDIHPSTTISGLPPVTLNTPPTIFLPSWDKKALENYLNNAIKISKELFNTYGIVKAPSILLTGEPGCGKTSLSLEIAKLMKVPIFYVTIFNERTRDILSEEGDDWRVVVFEDLDRILNQDVIQTQRGQNMLRSFLQFLDGSMALPKTVIIATMNHPDRVDEALIRPGRFDFRLEMKPVGEETAKKICNKFKVGYDILEGMEYPVSPAKLQSEIIANLAELRKKKEERNKCKK